VEDAVPLLPRAVLLHQHDRRVRDAEEPDRQHPHGGLLDGILLTALQAIWVGAGLYSPVFALGLAAGAVVFGWLTVTEAIPQILVAFAGVH
jgi:hypothetical protein